MKVTRRLLSWMLAISMIVGVLQTNTVTAYADEPQTGVETQVGGETSGTQTGRDEPGTVIIPGETGGSQQESEDIGDTNNDSSENDDDSLNNGGADNASDDYGVASKPTNDGIVYDNSIGGGIDNEYDIETYALSTVDLQNYITSLGLYKGSKASDATDANKITSGDPLTYGDKLLLAIQFYLPNDVLKDVDTSTVLSYDFRSVGLKFNNESNQALEYDGMEIGTYSIQNNVFSFSFNSSFFELGMNTFTGWANLFSTMNDSHGVNKNDTGYNWSFPGGYTFTGDVTPDTESYKLDISKDVDNNTGSLENREYKITVKSTGNNTDVKVTDTPGQYLTLVGSDNLGTAFTVTKKDGTTKSTTTLTKGDSKANGTYAVTKGADGKYTFELPDMADGDQYTISYKANIDSNALQLGGSNNWVSITGDKNNNKDLNNNVKVEYDKNGDNSKHEEKEKDKGVSIWKQWLNKTGSYDGEYITWTIKLNAGGANSDLSGATLKDTLDAKAGTLVEGSLTVDGALADLSITKADSSVAATWADLLNGGVKLPADSNLTGTYTITYKTKPTGTDPTKKENLNNKIEITPSGFTNPIYTTGTVDVGENHTYITKECATDNGQGNSTTISWKVTVDVPAGYNVKDNGSVMTDTLPNGMHLVAGTVKVDGNDAESYTTDNTNSFEVDLASLIVCDDEDANKAASRQKFVITFDTEFDKNDDGSYKVPTETTTYKNSARFYQTAEATYKYVVDKTAPTATKSYVWNSSEKTGVLYWKIEISDTNMIDLENGDKLTLIETIPAGLELGSAYYTWNVYNKNDQRTVLTPSGTTTNADGSTTVRFELTKEQAQAVINTYKAVYVEAKVADIASLEYNKSYTYTNKAQWELTQGKTVNLGNESTADGYYTNQTKVFDKTKDGDYRNGKLTYKIKVNENELTINGGNKISLTDTMGSAIDYKMGSLKVTYTDAKGVAHEKETWSGADKVAYDSKSHVLTIMGLEDATYYVITYEATTNLKAGAQLDSSNASNSVELTGSSSASLSDNYVLKTLATSSNAGGVVEGKTLKIYKYGDDDGANALRGAKFTIYSVEYVKGSGTISPSAHETQLKVVTTLSDGYATATGLKEDTLYLIKETQAPEGYVISDEYKEGVYFTFPSTQDEASGYNWPLNVTVYNANTGMPTIQINNDSESETAVKVKISKTDVGGTEIEGARLTIYDATGNEVESWTSGSDGSTGEAPSQVLNPHTVSLEPGTYKLVETTAPDGYEKAESITFVVLEDGKVTVNGTEVRKDEADQISVVTMVDETQKTEVEISKTDVGGVEIAGARLTITHTVTPEGGEPQTITDDTWTSEAGKSHKVKLAKGIEYTLTETLQPNGYAKAENITFKITEDGTVKVKTGTGSTEADWTAVTTVVMVDEYAPHTVKISKRTVTGTDELAGAELKITGRVTGADKDITPIKWISGQNDEGGGDTNPHQVQLQPGTYTLTETATPNSNDSSKQQYQKAESITFTVNADGTITSDGLEGDDTIVMYDKEQENTKVLISKKEITGTNEIKGAELTVTDSNGNEVASWTSDGVDAHGLDLANGEYTLTEITAPKGYKVAESIKFKVDAGNVYVWEGTGYKTTAETNNTVVMKDNYTGTEMEISKVDIGGNEVEGAQLTIYTGTNTTGDNNIAKIYKNGAETTEKAQWYTTANDSVHTVSLEPGTYTLVETQAPQSGKYATAESITFELAADGTITIKSGTSGFIDQYGVLNMVDEYTEREVRISKVDITNSAEIAGAELVITDKDGKVVEFTNDNNQVEQASWTSDGETSHAVKLTAGTYTLTETTAPNGYKKATSITFTVQDDGTIEHAAATKDETTGKYTITMKDEPEDTTKPVPISKRAVAGSNEIAGAHLQVLNNGKVVEEWDSVAAGSHTFYAQPGVTYTLVETTAPAGYEIAESITFSVDTKGKITCTGNSGAVVEGTLVMYDDYKENDVWISKQDIAGKRIDGAKLTLKAVTDYDNDGTADVDAQGNGKDAFGNTFNTVDLTPTANLNSYVQLKAGNYQLTEKTTPSGYKTAADIKFTVNKDGTVTSTNGTIQYYKGDAAKPIVVMTDEYESRKVAITKVDASDKSKGVAKAKLALTGYTTDKDGEKVKDIEDIQWQTTVNGTSPVAKSIELQPGVYTLSETEAPDGYEKAVSKEIVVKTDGTVTVDGTTVTATGSGESAVYAVTMADKVKTNPYDLKISKKDIVGNEIKGAKLTISGKAQVKNQGTGEWTDTMENIEDITWTSDGIKPYEVSLAPGEYTLTETYTDANGSVKDGNPAGYEKAQSITFTITYENGTYKVTSGKFEDGRLTMTDEYSYHAVNISKQDILGNEIAGAKLTIYKSDGKTIAQSKNENGQLENATWTSEAGKVHTVNLQPGKYVLVETLKEDGGVPTGYEHASSISFEVGIDGKVVSRGYNEDEGQIEMTDTWESHEVELSKEDVWEQEIEGATIEVTGKTTDGQTIDKISWVSEKDKSHKIKVQPGTYTMKETIAPEGYEIANEITFTVTVEGKVKRSGKIVDDVTMTDDYGKRTIKITKENIANGDEISGAQLTITQGKTVIDSWTSEAGKPHEVSYAFDPTLTYTLTEVVPASGYYNLSTSITFKVALNGDVTIESTGKVDGKDEGVLASDGKTIIVNNKVKPDEPNTPSGGDEEEHHNDPKPVVVKLTGSVALVKTDSVTGQALAGAVYNLYTKDGKLVGTYTTNEYGIIQVTDLDLDEYYFVEIQAPEGYIVDSWQKVFRLNKENTNKNPQIVAASNVPEEKPAQETVGSDEENGMMAGGEGGAISATGDDSMMTTYGIMAGLAAAVLAIWFVMRRKRQHI